MSVDIGPLPDVFFRLALDQVVDQIEAPEPIKQRLFDEALRLHNKSATRRDAVRTLGAVMDRTPWRWPQCEALLLSEGEDDPDPDDMLGILFDWLTMTTHGLYRRGQIRALLKQQMGHVIRVRIDTSNGVEVAPCGACDGEVLQPTSDILERMPPCKSLRCACVWNLMHPEQIEALTKR